MSDPRDRCGRTEAHQPHVWVGRGRGGKHDDGYHGAEFTCPGTPHFADDTVTLWRGDALTVLRAMPDEAVDCCVTSPPYFGLRDYGEPGQYGLEDTPAEYIAKLSALFDEVRRVLTKDGTLWLNLGDSYATQGGRRTIGDSSWTAGRTRLDSQPDKPRSRPTDIAPKNLRGIPWRVALALQDAGWILRNDIIWAKPNAMPESVTDRLACRHEHLFMLTKSHTYWFDLDPIREQLLHPDAADGSRVFGGKTGGAGKVGSSFRTAGGMPNTYGGERTGKNPGDVWSIPTQPFAEAHFAVMPLALAERAVLAGCKPGGVVLDPFSGSGTTGLAASKHGRRYVGIDLNADYLDLSLRTRLRQTGLIEDGGAA